MYGLITGQRLDGWTLFFLVTTIGTSVTGFPPFFRFEKHLSAADVRVFSRLAAFESALLGIGQVWDHYYYGFEVAEALREVGLGGVVAPTLQDLAGPGAERSQDATSTSMNERRRPERGSLLRSGATKEPADDDTCGR